MPPARPCSKSWTYSQISIHRWRCHGLTVFTGLFPFLCALWALPSASARENPPVITVDGRSTANLSLQESSSSAHGVSELLISGYINITDADNDNTLTSANISLRSPISGEDRLGLQQNVTSIKLISNSSTSLKFEGTAPFQSYVQLLKNVTYENTATAPANLSTAPRIVDILVSDGQLTGNFTVEVTMLPRNNRPFLYTQANASTKQYSSIISDYTYTTTFFEDGPAVPILPSDFQLVDIDSHNMSKAEISLVGVQDQGSEFLDIASMVAASGVTIRRRQSRLLLTGTASTGVYHSLLKSVTYINNVTTEPNIADRSVTVQVWDDEMLASNITMTTVQVNETNDVPQLDLGGGYGNSYTARFTEGVTGTSTFITQAVSTRLLDPDSSTLTEVNILLNTTTANGSSFRNDREFILPNGPFAPTIRMNVADQGRTLKFTSAGNPSFLDWENLFSSIAYHNAEPEPSIHTHITEGSAAVLRQVVWLLQDERSQELTQSSANTIIDVKTINDNPPQLCAANSACSSPSCSHARRKRSVVDVRSVDYKALSQKMAAQMKKMAPRVATVHVFPSTRGKFISGATITVSFNFPTNTPRLTAETLRLSPSRLERNYFVSLWTDSRTLMIYFPDVSSNDEVQVHPENVKIRFLPPEGPCSEGDVCQDRICHADRWSCSVVGAFDSHNLHGLNQLDPDKDGHHYSQLPRALVSLHLCSFYLGFFLFLMSAYLSRNRGLVFFRAHREPLAQGNTSADDHKKDRQLSAKSCEDIKVTRLQTVIEDPTENLTFKQSLFGVEELSNYQHCNCMSNIHDDQEVASPAKRLLEDV